MVNIGDMLQVWTNGLWESTKHRVIHKGTGYRVSVPYFYEPNWDTIASPLERCVQASGGVKKFDAVMFGDHLSGKASGNFHSGGKKEEAVEEGV